MNDAAVALYDPEAEGALLGRILRDNSAIGFVAAHLKPEDFGTDAHRMILLGMLELAKAHKPIESTSLMLVLDGKGWELPGGGDYVLGLHDDPGAARELVPLVQAVQSKARLRRSLDAAPDVREDATRPESLAAEEPDESPAMPLPEARLRVEIAAFAESMRATAKLRRARVARMPPFEERSDHEHHEAGVMEGQAISGDWVAGALDQMLRW